MSDPAYSSQLMNQSLAKSLSLRKELSKIAAELDSDSSHTNTRGYIHDVLRIHKDIGGDKDFKHERNMVYWIIKNSLNKYNSLLNSVQDSDIPLYRSIVHTCQLAIALFDIFDYDMLDYG